MAGDQARQAIETGAAQHWNTVLTHRYAHRWQHPTIQAAVNKRISGDERVSQLAHFKQTYAAKPFNLALSIGCGLGTFERDCVRAGVCERLIGIDLASERIEAAKVKVEPAYQGRIDFQVASISTFVPPKGIDLIIARMVLHHISDLEQVLDKLARILAPGGVIYFHEFVGPNRWQWTDKQLALCNRIFATFPQELRRDLTGFQEYKQHIGRPPVERMIELDPSESIRSAEIERALKKRFTWIERKSYGGTLLNPIFSRIMGNFESREDLVKLVIEMEDILIEEGVIPSDHVWGVLRHKRISDHVWGILRHQRTRDLVRRSRLARAAAQPLRRVISRFGTRSSP
jgi:SAM-dependent methyltransferase